MIDEVLILRIRESWRMRQRWHRAEKSLVLQAKAICRWSTAGDKDEADKLFARISKGGSVNEPMLELALQPFLSSIAQFAELRKGLEKDLRQLARQLPVWTWAVEIRGFAEFGLAMIVGEAGDLGKYRNHSCLWKRMGLAVMDGTRQGGLSKTAAAEDWIAHGYSPTRRSVMFNIGDPLIKLNQTGEYRSAYLARKEYELARDPEMQPMKAHRRAQRYMEKRLLKHLWQAWRRASLQEVSVPITLLPAAELSVAA